MKKASNPIIEEAYQKSLAQLKDLISPAGFVASSVGKDNYYRVFSRDGVIAGLAATLSEDPELIKATALTLQTLARHQDETGRIPSNISIDHKKVSYGTNIGRVDATIWYVIGVCQLALVTGDKTVFNQSADSVKKALFYLKCLELNGRGLIYIPQGGDWADEYINHGYVLLDQLLYYFALRSYSILTGDKEVKQRTNSLKRLIEVNYLPDKKNRNSSYIYNWILFQRSLKEYKGPLPIPYFSNHSVRYHTDNFANALLILSNILDNKRQRIIQKYIVKHYAAADFPVIPAFYPVIKENSHAWGHLRLNYLYRFKNKPYQYHNGGLWPLVQGFFIASFGSLGQKHLAELAATLKRDNYVFPEYYHGQNYKAMGTKHLAFSASAYILAYQAVAKQRPIFS